MNKRSNFVEIRGTFSGVLWVQILSGFGDEKVRKVDCYEHTDRTVLGLPLKVC